jgi:phage terminase large subunit-like protein
MNTNDPAVQALLSNPAALQKLHERAAEKLAERQLELYRPYDKQRAFHAYGATMRERLLMAGNQLGKSYCGAAEAAYHLTGDYPDWWQGRRFDKPITMWAAGVTSEATRDVPQRLLMGRVGAIGTGLIPKKSIVEHSSTRGIADALDTVVIKHKTGRNSRLAFKSYEKGREKWQGETLDVVWLDEEPPPDIYTEALTRTNATGGMVYMTFTPLLGMSDVVRMFYPQPNTADRVVVKMTIEDAEHISAEDRQRIINSYPAHEREARVAGVPMLGSGRVFPVPESAIICEPFTLPGHWPRIAGLDLGWDHPTAAAKLAWDRDNDVVYVTHSYRVREATILQHAAALKAWGNQLPFAWPHDALSHDRGSGETMAELYRRQGLNMLFERAMFEDGGAGVEAGIAMMLDRLETGRLKIFAHLEDWRSEYRLYHRKDGKVVKENDDLMCLDGATKVVTSEGLRRIDEMVGSSGYVMTTGGKWTAYRNCRKTRIDAPLVRLQFADGRELVCTPDHKILTPEGWTQAIEMEGRLCHTAISSSIHDEGICGSSFSTTIDRNSTGAFTHGSAGITGSGLRGCTVMSGSTTKAPCRRVSTSITSITAAMITRLKTFWRFTARNIFPITTRATAEGPTQQSPLSAIGGRRTPAVNFSGAWACGTRSTYSLPGRSIVSGVQASSPPLIGEIIGFAPTLASLHGGEPPAQTTNSASAKSAARHSWLIGTASKEHARGSAQASSAGTSAVECLKVSDAGRGDVYCMEVPETEAFAVEGGFIVHNCGTRYALMCLRFATLPKGAQSGPLKRKIGGLA